MAEMRIPGDHVLDRSFDRETNSIKTQLLNTDIAIELSAEDGDSVTAKKTQVCQAVSHGDIINIHGMDKVAIYTQGEGPITISVSPEETGSLFFDIYGSPSVGAGISTVCGERAKINAPNATSIHICIQG